MAEVVRLKRKVRPLIATYQMPIDCPPAIHQPAPGKHFCVYKGERGGWWAHIEGHAYPFGAWRMDSGPYPFKWMAELAFPIERLTKDGPRQ